MKNENNQAESNLSKQHIQMKVRDPKEDVDIINLLKIIDINSTDINNLFIKLNEFEEELKSLKDLNFLLNYENFEILKKLNEKDNVRINLIISKIFLDIINKESLYSNFLLVFNEDKINLIIQIIEESVSLTKKLNGFIFDSNIFKFKIKILSLTKFIYFNHKSNLNNTSTKKLEYLLYSIPSLFFSEAYNELNKEKDYFEIYRSFDLEKMISFEDKFTKINNYFEQFEIFYSFVQYNLGEISNAKLSGGENEEMEQKKFIKKCMNALNKIEFYQQYGLLLLKFCLYHKYIFLLKEDEVKENSKNEGKEISKVVFLLDQVIEEENKGKKINENKIDELMNKKLFISVTESKEYNELIKKEIDNYLNLIKKAENDEKFKQIVYQLRYFLSIINEESYVPLYLSDLSKITFNDNFSPFYSLNVPAGTSTELYLETTINETMLLNIEFHLEDKTKDITFEVKKYDINNNTFKNIIKEEKILDSFKFFVLCNGYCLYQIVFNNTYSWFHSKDINYRISLLKSIDKNKYNKNDNLGREKEKKEEKQKIKEENQISKERNKLKTIQNSNAIKKEKAIKKEEIKSGDKKEKKLDAKSNDKNEDKKTERKNVKINKQIEKKNQENKDNKLEEIKEKIKEEKNVEIKEKHKEEKKEEKKEPKIEIIKKIINKKNVNKEVNIKDKKIDENKEKKNEEKKKDINEIKKEEKKSEIKEEIKEKKIEQNEIKKDDIKNDIKIDKKEKKQEEIDKREKKEEINKLEEKKKKEREEIKIEKTAETKLNKKEEIKVEKNEKLKEEKKVEKNSKQKDDIIKEVKTENKENKEVQAKEEKKLNEKMNKDILIQKKEEQTKNMEIKVKKEDIKDDNSNDVLVIKKKEQTEEIKDKKDDINLKKANNKEDNLDEVLLIKKKEQKDEKKETTKEKRKEVVNEEKGIKKLEGKKEKEMDKKKKDEVKENKKNEIKKDIKEKKEEKKFNCIIHGKNICFDINKINMRIKDFDDILQDEIIINIPIILYLNNLTFVSIKKEIVKFIEKISEDEKIIAKSFFDFQIINYLQKNLKLSPKDAKFKKILITLFNQNREIALSEENKERILIWKDSKKRDLREQAKYLEKIGFYPSQILEGYNVEYNLYDLCEQGLLYHLILSKEKNIKIEKSLYFINFDKKVANAAVFSKGKILTKLSDEYGKSRFNYFNNINISDHNQLLSIIEKVNNTFKGIDLILTYFDNTDKNEKKKLFELFDVIRIHCKKNVHPSIEVTVYSQNEIYNNVFNYSILFYDN